MTRPRRGTLADLRTRRYRTKRPIANRLATLPAGTEVQIIGKHNGVTIQATACKTCGVEMRIGRVDLYDLEEIHQP